MIEKNETQLYPETCGVRKTMSVIGGKWKIRIIYALQEDINRFGALHRYIDGISKKMLTDNLRELEADGIIHREVYAQVPPKVVYSLTELGESLKPIIAEINQWGLNLRGNPDTCPPK